MQYCLTVSITLLFIACELIYFIKDNRYNTHNVFKKNPSKYTTIVTYCVISYNIMILGGRP